MRPPLLDPLFASLKTLPGVGPKVEKLFARLLGRDEGETRVVDLLFHLPTGTIDRHRVPSCVMSYPGTLSQSL
jgi:ATP-dependent DNA helicase RecG